VLVGKSGDLCEMSKKLVEEREYSCIKTSKVLKDYVDNGTDSVSKEKWEKGEDLDEELVVKLMSAELKKVGRVVVENFPRNSKQLTLWGGQVDCVVNVTAGESAGESARWLASQQMVR